MSQTFTVKAWNDKFQQKTKKILHIEKIVEKKNSTNMMIWGKVYECEYCSAVWFA